MKKEEVIADGFLFVTRIEVEGGYIYNSMDKSAHIMGSVFVPYAKGAAPAVGTEDLVDSFRAWEETHNRDNYGRYDAFKAGYELGRSVNVKTERSKTLEEAANWLADDLGDFPYSQYFLKRLRGEE